MHRWTLGVGLMGLVGCGSAAPEGTWVFTWTPAATDEAVCTPTLTHNFVGASAPVEAADVWETSSRVEAPQQRFFGRVEASAGGAVLILGDRIWLGQEKSEGRWRFTYESDQVETAEEGEVDTGAAATADTGFDTGTAAAIPAYAYTQRQEHIESLRIDGTFADGTFKGVWVSGTTDTQSWTESDAWGDTAAAVVGESGRIPAATWLTVTDGAGAAVPASNARSLTDCHDARCTLTVGSACQRTDTLVGEQTELSSEDAGWTAGAGEAP